MPTSVPRILVALLVAGLCLPAIKAAPAAQRVLYLPLDTSLQGAAGQQPTEFARASAATCFDAATGKLVEVAPNVPRFEQWAGQAVGEQGRGYGWRTGRSTS